MPRWNQSRAITGEGSLSISRIMESLGLKLASRYQFVIASPKFIHSKKSKWRDDVQNEICNLSLV